MLSLSRALTAGKRHIGLTLLLVANFACRASVDQSLDHYLRESWAQSCDQSLVSAADGVSFKILHCWASCSAGGELGVGWLDKAFADSGRAPGATEGRILELMAFALVGLAQACILAKENSLPHDHVCQDPGALFKLTLRILLPCTASSTDTAGHPAIRFVTGTKESLPLFCERLAKTTAEDTAALFWLAAANLGATELVIKQDAADMGAADDTYDQDAADTGAADDPCDQDTADMRAADTCENEELLDLTFVKALLSRVLRLLIAAGPKWNDSQAFFLSGAIALKGIIAIRDGEHPDFDPCDTTDGRFPHDVDGYAEGIRWLERAWTITGRRLFYVPALAIHGLRDQAWPDDCADAPNMCELGKVIGAMVASARDSNACTSWPAYAALNSMALAYIHGAWDTQKCRPLK